MEWGGNLGCFLGRRVARPRDAGVTCGHREGGKREEPLQRAGDTGVISHSRGVLVPAVEELYLGIKAEYNNGFVPRDVGVNWEWQGVDTCHTDGCGRATPVAAEELQRRRPIEERAGKIHTTCWGGTRRILAGSQEWLPAHVKTDV